MNFLFPRFEKAGKQVELVKVLREQHQAGRRVTDVTISLLKGGVLSEKMSTASPESKRSSASTNFRSSRRRSEEVVRIF